jgi:NAD(P) transhydrogenase subunit alpha
MRIAVLSETDPVETRVAATPDMVKKYKNLGADVVVQAGAGGQASISDVSSKQSAQRSLRTLAMQSRTPISSSKSAGRPTAN